MSPSSLLAPLGPHNRHCVWHLRIDFNGQRAAFPYMPNPITPPFPRSTEACLFPLRVGVIFAKTQKLKKFWNDPGLWKLSLSHPRRMRQE